MPTTALQSSQVRPAGWDAPISGPIDCGLKGRRIGALVHTAGVSPSMTDGRRVFAINFTATKRLVEAHTNPAGRLPYTVYRSDTNLVPMNDRDVSKGATCLYCRGRPEYAFGHGLSYTSFTYSKLGICALQMPRGPLQVSADGANTGARDGDEVVQVYIRDRAARVTRPNVQPVAFQRVSLKAGGKRSLTFSVLPRDFAYRDDGANPGPWRPAHTT